jgi:hypothetical protein
MVPDSAGISEDAVLLKTGKTWAEWHALLDAAGAATRKHKENAAWLAAEHEVSPWWAQMITVSFERARGLRDKYQRADGRFQGSLSRTFSVGDDVLFRFLVRAEERARWLPETLTLTAAAEPRSARFSVDADGTRVDAYLLSLGDGRARLTMNHAGLADAAAVEARKAFWKDRLEALRLLVETPETPEAP